MCGRYTLLTEEECRELERIAEAVDRKYGASGCGVKRGEIFPTDQAPILLSGSEARTETASELMPELSPDLGQGLIPELAIWGFPRFSPKVRTEGVSSAQGRTGVVINARAETAREKAMFRRSFETGRCVVPAAGFFEWKKDGDLSVGSGRRKGRKYLFRRTPGQPLYMAGLTEEFEGQRRFVILTTEANDSMRGIHHRMPVILTEEQLREWLEDPRAAARILKETPPILEKEAAPEAGQQLSFEI